MGILQGDDWCNPRPRGVPHVGMRTPWGKAQTCDKMFEGCWDVTTAGHGGLKLSAALQRLIPAKWRCSGGWYEEDCEALIVRWFFFDRFDMSPAVRPVLLAGLKASIIKWWPDLAEDQGARLTTRMERLQLPLN